MSPVGITCAGLGGNVVLSVVKVLGGLAFGSRTLLADGIHSVSDLASDVAVLAGLKVSGRRPDQSHPYGHRRVQALVSMGIGATVLAAAIGVGISAVKRWHQGQFTTYGWAPLCMALISVVVKEVLYRLTHRVGRRGGDSSLLANAWHHRSDAVSSLAAAAGMFGVAAGGARWAFLDHLTAIALAALLIVIGLKLIAQPAQELIDRAPARELMAGIASVMEETDGVCGYHAFRMRQLGGKLEMDVHIQVRPALTVAEGHEIATMLQRRIMRADEKITSVTIHIEPAEGS